MKKSQPPKRSQLSKALSEYNNTNHTLKLAKTPLSNLEQYELLRADFIAENPNASDIEIIKACINFANHCGLIVCQKLLEINLHRLGVKNVD